MEDLKLAQQKDFFFCTTRGSPHVVSFTYSLREREKERETLLPCSSAEAPLSILSSRSSSMGTHC